MKAYILRHHGAEANKEGSLAMVQVGSRVRPVKREIHRSA